MAMQHLHVHVVLILINLPRNRGSSGLFKSHESKMGKMSYFESLATVYCHLNQRAHVSTTYI